MAKKFNLKYGVFLPLVLLITIFLWAVPVSFSKSSRTGPPPCWSSSSPC